MNKIVDVNGQAIPQTLELTDEVAAGVRQRLIYLAQAEHQLNCIKFELEMYLKQENEQLRTASNIALDPSGTRVQYV